MSVSSIQLPTERALQAFLQAACGNDSAYSIICAHDVEILPQEGNYIAIIAGPGNFEELIDNATSRVEFRIATQVAEAGQRADRTAQHQAVVGSIHDLLSWQNFEDALPALNAQQTSAGGITIGVSGWEQVAPPLDTHTDSQIISTLPYDFDVFIASAES
jgi:hypothetical protein